jgi:DNA-binding transcriptional ArsR family regulator
MDSYQQQANIFKALMHPARLAILDVLRDDEQCVCHMEAILDYRQAYISQQLAALREAGLVEARRDGWNIYYHVVKPEIYQLIDIAKNITRKKTPGLASPDPAESRDRACPCPKCNQTASGTPPENIPVVIVNHSINDIS